MRCQKGHQQQKFKKMSKILKQYHPISQSSLKQIKQMLNEQIHQKKSFSIFDKLQIYDKIIGQFQVCRTDPQVLKIFSQLIVDHGQVYLQSSRANFNGNFYLDGKQNKNNYHSGIFSSPTYHKKQGNDVDDPQLFSFSKTRRQAISNHIPNQVSQKLPAFSMFEKNKNKIKQNSDKPRYTVPVLTQPHQRKVSEFNSELDLQKYDKVTINRKEEDGKSSAGRQIELDSINSLHQLSRKLKIFLLTKNSTLLFRFLRNNLSRRKKQFKAKTSQFIYELKLLKKSWESIKTFNNHTQQVLRQFKSNKNKEKLLTYFGEWYFYANRTEQQRQREKLVKVKQIFLIKVLNIRRFIKNNQVPIQQIYNNGQENISPANKRSLQSYNQYLCKSIQTKAERLKKVLFLKQSRSKLLYKREIENKKQLLEIGRKKYYYELFVKLLSCIKQTQRIKYEKLTNIVEYKVNGRRLLNKLKGEYHFQKVYWTDQNDTLKLGRRQSEPNEFKLQESKYQIIENKKNKQFSNIQMLNPKYKKILFIYEIMDCVYHNLNRKGYTFLKDMSSKSIETADQKRNSMLETLLQEHPAYKNYYKPYKLFKYFTALKKHLLEDNAKKINEIKYKINGKRVLHNGILKWYKDELIKSVINEQILNKREILSDFLDQKNKKEFFQLFGSKVKYFQKKSQVQNLVRSNNIVNVMRTLKTYLVSKKYYRKIILQSKLSNRHKIQQNYFLEWKLLYAENVHNRLLEKDMENIRKKYAIKAIKNIISQFSLADKIFKKKCKNLQKMRYQNYSDQFITLLRKNWQAQRKCSNNTKQQIQKKILQTEQALKIRQKGKFTSELMQYWYQCKLQRQVKDHIDEQYRYRLLFKSFACLKQMRKVQKQEQQKLKKIKTKREGKIKRNIMGQFIDMLIKKILLKRMSTITKKYYFSLIKENIFMEQQSKASQN